MQDTSTTNNSLSTLPPTNERKNNIAQVLDNPEYIEARDMVGQFEQETPKFNALGGGELLFNLPKLDNFIPFEKTEVPPAFQKAFENDDESKLDPTKAVSDVFREGAFVTLGAAKSGAGAIGNILKDTFSAVTDVVKNDIAFETPKEQKQDPEKQAEEQKKAMENQYKTQVLQNTEDEITSIRNTKERIARMAHMKNEISDLTGLQAMLSGKSSLITEAGEVRTDLQDDVENARKQIMRAQQGQSNDLTLSNKEKHGIDMRADHVEQQGATAQTAVG